MASKYDGLARIILQNVGGKNNIEALEHCFTRLRFRLKDETKVNADALSQTEGVINVLSAGGQFQVVIGTHVPDVYEAFRKIAHLDNHENTETEEQKGVFNRLTDILSGIFMPAIGLLCACGILKGLLTIGTMTGLLTNTSGTYQTLYAIADVIFYFFPIFLGFTASKKFNVNPITGIAIGAIMVYPTLIALSSAEPVMTLFTGTFLESKVTSKFAGIPMIMNNYTSTVFPVIIAMWFAGKVERVVKKIIPNVIGSFGIPLITLIIVMPITFLVIGPVATWISLGLSSFALWLYEISPIIFGLFLGGFWQLFVIFGVHTGFFPIVLNSLATVGYDIIFAATWTTVFTQMAILLAIIIKTKNIKLKSTSISALFSAIFGITEPAIYGVTLPLKKPFLISCISSAIGGAVVVAGGAKYYTMGGQGIFGFLCFVNPDGTMTSLLFSVIGVIVAMIISFTLTLIIFKDKKTTEKKEKHLEMNEDIVILSPLEGKVLPLSEVKDSAFSSESLGKGAAIYPESGKVVAPFNGKVEMVFETGHAIGLSSDSGVELIIHVGLDTVNLKGKYFNKKVSQGDFVKQGQVLIEFDVEALKKEGYDITTPVIVNNNENVEMMEFERNYKIKTEEGLLKVQKEVL